MVNKVTLIGRLGKDPEVRTLESGTNIAKLSLATDESYKDKSGEWQTITEWHNIIMWRDMAERAERMLKKGYLVYIEGKLTNRSWQDENGNTKYITEVRANTFRLLRSEMNGDRTNGQVSKPNNVTTTTADASDDLPF
ncbi:MULTISPECIES: single-stranded DNA-binding protein [unclassified Aureispira]|uniref:single-stranded DNA-binding protein n=1 Tax=unclassified Aureispira TaxID=2649989 RepID=UPI000696C333|nr:MULTISPECIES: single-stranded DNA-binding protein [unclassified Aureispira]WMX14765.1 single-stranded DNA-binding protein [Aureispira sp. CCB-E]